MANQLFTIMCEFDGGTYLSQVHAPDEQQALIAWSEVVARERPMGDDALLIAYTAAAGKDDLTAVAGLSGVWCWSGMVENRLILSNFVRSA
ncbi:hypothetical protein D0Z70_07805 [Sphingobium terrigena]|uniref:Uncharacterized protein n=1 Tax=Sphingobium terrigena TaxID=2304063 RepID=A0A418YUW1_9SPHN|nr:hypothetical protein [Sphingobium terrigena]RJG55926.1 hypothetical protein D0Z70_07805 [Sphingobium terrigena]